MSSTAIEWITIEHLGKEIGAVGFIHGRATVLAAYYDALDANLDGEVSLLEAAIGRLVPFDMERLAFVNLVMASRTNLEVIARDASLAESSYGHWLGLAVSMHADAVFEAYARGPAGRLSKLVSDALGAGRVASFAVREGMERSVRRLYDAVTP